MQNRSLSKNPHICAERLDYTPIGIRDAIDLRQVFQRGLGIVSGEWCLRSVLDLSGAQDSSAQNARELLAMKT